MQTRLDRVPSMLSVAALLSVALGSNAYAASDDEIYKGKTVTVVIGYSVGGGYDMYGRLLARHMGKHMPASRILCPRICLVQAA